MLLALTCKNVVLAQSAVICALSHMQWILTSAMTVAQRSPDILPLMHATWVNADLGYGWPLLGHYLLNVDLPVQATVLDIGRKGALNSVQHLLLSLSTNVPAGEGHLSACSHVTMLYTRGHPP